MKLSDYVMQFVASRGVKHVFMIPGGGAMHLNDSLGKCAGLEFVCNLHEQASAIAAENYSKMTGNLGCAMVTTGPGGTNAITGVAGAWLDSTPMLVVSGQVKRADLKRDTGVRSMGVQEVDITTLVASIVKYAALIMDPATIRYHLEKAVYLAKSGRPGPVWIDIPLDVQASTIDPDHLKGFHPDECSSDAPVSGSVAAAVKHALAMLAQAKRPVLLLGNGVRLAGATDHFLELATLLQIPILPTWLAIDLVEEDHPLYMGRPGSVAPRGANFALQNSDWLLAIGARLDLALTAYAPEKMARGAKKIVVDIDPAELGKLKPAPDLPVRADARVFIDEMLRQAKGRSYPDFKPWIDRCREWKAKWPIVKPEHRQGSGLVSVFHLSEVISAESADGDLIVSGSSGAGIEIFLLAYKVRKYQRIFHTTALGAMGFGIPASIGACLGAGRRQTICVDGDGGFEMNIQELATVRRLNLPIKFFILSNRGFSSIRASQKNWFGRLVAADDTSGLTFPDATRVAAAYDLPTARIEDRTDLAGQVRRILAMPGPVVVDVMTLPDETREPRVSSVQRPDGSMVSRPLEDLYPFLERDELRANMMVPLLEE
jgi:acetolactate synthase-1/2/3 large subunit